jgi:hypothetical protein
MSSKLRTNQNPAEIEALETQLEGLFRPVAARQEFVSGLRTRLEAPPSPPAPRLDAGQFFLLGGLGILAALAVLILGIRAGMALLTALGLMQQVRGQVEQRQPKSAI